jgi:hypothetical protein
MRCLVVELQVLRRSVEVMLSGQVARNLVLVILQVSLRLRETSERAGLIHGGVKWLYL